MLRLNIKDITFIIVFICLFSLCYSFQIYINKQEKFHELSNELYTNHHSVFISNGDYDWLKKPLTKTDYRVFIEYNDTYRTLLVNNSDWSPPIITGRFFSKNDKGAKAVIGKEMIELTKDDNGKKYISFQGTEFEVIGIMGASFASPTDYLILLNNPSQLPMISGARIILDSESKSIVNDISKNITKIDPSVTLIESTQKGLSRTANIPFFYRLLIFEFYLLLFLSVFAFLRYWYEKEKMVIYILHLLGISKSKINAQLFIKLCFNIIISGSITVFLTLIINFHSIIILKQMVWMIIIFIFSTCLLLLIFVNSNHLYSKRGVVRK